MRYRFRDIEVDLVGRTINRNGESRPVPSRAFDVLVYLIENRDRVVPREEILESVWADVVVEDGNLTQNVSVLRRAIGDRSAERPVILTVPGQGYRFTENVGVELRSSPGVDRPLVRWRVLVPLLAIVILGVSIGATARRQPAPVSDSALTTIAVLPVRSGGFDMSADQKTMRVTDAVIRRLAGDRDGLSVRSSSAVAEFSDPFRDTPTEAGEQLEVSFVLVGYLADSGPAALAEFQLVDVRRDAVVWSTRWSGSIDDERDRESFAAEISDAVAFAAKSAR